MPDLITLEICANSALSALAAQKGGAQRVELCENLKQAGTTPSYGQIALARKLINIDLYVLIRPRSGDFLYNDNEFEIMRSDVKACIDLGCDGIVIGILNSDGSIDKERNTKLLEMATQAGLGTTFHRAFDVCNDYTKGLEDVIDLGFDRILTSGGKLTAMEGAGVINHLVKQANGRIRIMAGSGVNEDNVKDLIHFTGVHEVHTSARKIVRSGMYYHNDYVAIGDMQHDLYDFDQTDEERVKRVLKLANS